ncbi:hypothetical protein B0H11DRAFT_2426684 [Mycena galericulata]|nr:hypothetical protein B0H11DRAFT_2426684 [Mycena galericulata]
MTKLRWNPGPEAVSSSDKSDDSEDEKPKDVQVKAAVPAKAGAAADSSDDSDSDDEPAPAPPKKSAAASTKKAAAAPPCPPKNPHPKRLLPTNEAVAPKSVAPKAAAKKPDASSSEDDSSDSDSEKKPAAAAAPAANSAKASESSDNSDEEMPDVPAPAVNGKRKAPNGDATPTKKVKLANGDAAPASGGEEEIKSIFEFAACGEVVSATVAMDRNTGHSRGFGHVHFTTTEAVEAALKMNGQEIDGRPVNIDYGRPADKSKVRENRAKTYGDSPSEPSATLFVGNLSFGVDEDAVWSFFNECGGGVKSVRLPTDRDTGRPKGFGYVEFEDIEGAKKAYEAANGQEIEGRAIRLDYSQPRDSSGGGGRGGGFGGDRGGRGGRGDFGDRGGRRQLERRQRKFRV